MANLFQKIKVTRPKSNKFDLSHERKFSMQMGKLVPCFVQEFLPGDSFRVSCEMLIRLAPLIAPVMHRMNVYVHFFKVPNRLVWDEWQDFITGGRLGTSNPVMPHFPLNDVTIGDMSPVGHGSLWDYLGLPSLNDSPIYTAPEEVKINALPFRAYQLIYDEYYRDQNLQSDLDISKASGAITGSEIAKLLTLRDRAWEKDYFTSCLPWAQRGDEVLIPMEADVEYSQQSHVINSTTDGVVNNNDLTLTPNDAATYGGATLGARNAANVDGIPIRIENIEGITNAVVTINDLRTSVQLQKWLEANARGGSRYIEQILVHFGVKSSDARLQRPEYLGGGKANVVISEVLSTTQFEGGTSGAVDDLPQGNMAGHGVGVGRSNQFSTYCEEHGWIIGICSFLPTTAYMQGIPRQFSRMDKYDYYWREFAHLGEQAVLNKELYFNELEDASTPNGTFGYQSRYAEYKYQPSTVHGAFRGSLDFWHMGRIFGEQPVLNQAFVTSDPTKRIFAVTDANIEDLYVQLYNRVDARRLMPYFGTPSGFTV